MTAIDLHEQNLLLARHYLDKGMEGKARSTILSWRLRSTSVPHLQCKWGELCEEIGMARQAMENYSLALKADPGHERALYRLACLLGEVGYFEKSTRYLKKILRNNPDHGDARKILRRNYEALGLLGQAEAVSVRKGQPRRTPTARYFPPSVGKEEIDTFLELFSGREVGFALEGVDPDTGNVVYDFHSSPLGAKEIKEHVLGDITLAIYPLRSDNTIRFAGLLLHIPLQVRERYAGQHSYISLLDEKMRTYVLQLKKFAKNLGIPAYPEEHGIQKYRLWFFFENPIHFLRVKGFLQEFLFHVPEGDSHFRLEPQLPTKPVGIGWIERHISLPLGIDRRTLKRSLFLDNTGKPFDNQLKELKKIRRFSVKDAYKRLRSINIAGERKKDTAYLFEPTVRHLKKKCPVLSLIMDKSLSGQMLRQEEKVVVFYSLGLLDQDGSTIHTLLENTPDYNYRKVKQQWERLKKNPISCVKIRHLLPEITASVNCNCIFDLRGGKYPSPLMHINPHMVPRASEVEFSRRISIKEAAERYVQLTRHIAEQKRVLEKLETVLERHFSQRGINEYKMRDTKVVRLVNGSNTDWRIENL